MLVVHATALPNVFMYLKPIPFSHIINILNADIQYSWSYIYQFFFKTLTEYLFKHLK